MATVRASEDALHTSLPGSPPVSSNVGSPNGSGHDLDGMAHRSIDAQFKELRDILLPLARGFADFGKHVKTLSEPLVWLPPESPVLNKLSMPSLPRWRCLQRWSIISIASLLMSARSRHMQPLLQMYRALHDPGPQWNKLTAPQPQGPMAKVHLRTTETHDEGSILPQAQKMNKHEVPSYLNSPTNNTSKELHSGSIPLWKSLVCWHVTNLLEFIAKQVPCQLDLFLKREANVKTLLSVLRMMVFLMQSTVPSVAPILLSNCVNPDQLKSERSENNLFRYGEKWLQNLTSSSLMQMPKVYPSSPRSILDPKSSVSKIADMELANQCSNLLRLVTDKRLHLFHLTCLFLVFHMKCYNGFSLKPTGLMCVGRSLASPSFRRLAGRGAFFCGFLVRWVLRFVSHLIRNFAFCELSSCPRESSFSDCGHPCDPLSCLLFTALWLRCSQTLVVQETPKDVELTCSITSLFRAVTCLPMGPMSRSESSRPLLLPNAPSNGLRRVALTAPERSRWRQGTLQIQPQILQRTTGWDGCGPILSEGLRCITWNTRGLVGSVFSRQRHREPKLIYLKKLLDHNNISLSPGRTWQGRVSSSYSSIGSVISTFWYTSS